MPLWTGNSEINRLGKSLSNRLQTESTASLDSILSPKKISLIRLKQCPLELEIFLYKTVLLESGIKSIELKPISLVKLSRSSSLNKCLSI